MNACVSDAGDTIKELEYMYSQLLGEREDELNLSDKMDELLSLQRASNKNDDILREKDVRIERLSERLRNMELQIKALGDERETLKEKLREQVARTEAALQESAEKEARMAETKLDDIVALYEECKAIPDREFFGELKNLSFREFFYYCRPGVLPCIYQAVGRIIENDDKKSIVAFADKLVDVSVSMDRTLDRQRVEPGERYDSAVHVKNSNGVFGEVSEVLFRGVTKNGNVCNGCKTYVHTA